MHPIFWVPEPSFSCGILDEILQMSRMGAPSFTRAQQSSMATMWPYSPQGCGVSWAWGMSGRAKWWSRCSSWSPAPWKAMEGAVNEILGPQDLCSLAPGDGGPQERQWAGSVEGQGSGTILQETPRQADFDQDIFRVCRDLSRCFVMCFEIPRWEQQWDS